ncbi:MAG: hypothetical protein E6230_02635 [Paenibacillus dendritiformis]|uniref:hypothetical protein n=1 Tax=uncultured Paenibacillus sp. TaxID=227322 RepID=UPI0025D4486D|nr:hypothetical protein [uncultured Paenibacillus sp.]MDU5141070.1 hypothetical protein [Paenibacillus dendritiformis]
MNGKMYTLRKEGAVKVTTSEAKRAALLALGYEEVADKKSDKKDDAGSEDK